MGYDIRIMSGQSITTTSWWKTYRSAVRTGETQRVEVFVRSLGPPLGTHGHRSWIFGALDEAVAAGNLDEYETTITGEQLCLCESCLESRLGRTLVAKLVRIRNPRDQNVEPMGFDTRKVESTITHEQYRVLIPPSCCISVAVDDTVHGLFPCRIDGEAYWIRDFLDALVSDRSERRRQLERP